MMRIVFWGLALLLCFSGCGSRSPKAGFVVGAIELPDGNTRDLGVVDEAQVVSSRFRIRNAGTETVEFDPLISKSCGCAEATLEKARLLPGEDTFLDLRLSASNTGGRQYVVTATVRVKQPGPASELRFGLAYNSISKWGVSPSEVRVSGLSGELVRTTVVVRGVRDSSAPNVLPGIVMNAPDAKVVSLRELDPNRPGVSTSWEAIVEFRCRPTPGLRTFNLLVTPKGESSSHVSATLVCRSLARLRVVPPVVALKRNPTDQSAHPTASAEIVPEKGVGAVEHIEIEGVDRDGVVAEIVDNPDENGHSIRRVVIRWNPAVIPPKGIGLVRLRCRTGGSYETVEVPFVLPKP